MVFMWLVAGGGYAYLIGHYGISLGTVVFASCGLALAAPLLLLLRVVFLRRGATFEERRRRSASSLGRGSTDDLDASLTDDVGLVDAMPKGALFLPFGALSCLDPAVVSAAVAADGHFVRADGVLIVRTSAEEANAPAQAPRSDALGSPVLPTDVLEGGDLRAVEACVPVFFGAGGLLVRVFSEAAAKGFQHVEITAPKWQWYYGDCPDQDWCGKFADAVEAVRRDASDGACSFTGRVIVPVFAPEDCDRVAKLKIEFPDVIGGISIAAQRVVSLSAAIDDAVAYVQDRSYDMLVYIDGDLDSVDAVVDAVALGAARVRATRVLSRFPDVATLARSNDVCLETSVSDPAVS